jgi:poly(3-hydroxybutyrate) depolymerase
MTAAMLSAYPDVFAAGAVIAGLPYGAADNVQQALSTMRHATALSGPDLKSLVTRAAPPPARWPRLSIWHGAGDATVEPGNAAALARQWTALLDLPPQPDTREMEGRWTRERWLGDDGAVMVERNTVAGLGHGMPLAASGGDPIGRAAPYMLEAGVSSALEIARFWGLAPAGPALRAKPRGKASAPPPASGIGADIMNAVSPHIPAKVGEVIARALKSAGLMS